MSTYPVRVFLTAVISSTFFLSTVCSAEKSADLFSTKIVWADDIPNFTTDLSSPNRNRYGAHYPYELGVRDPKDVWGSMATNSIAVAKAQGVDGLKVDIFVSTNNVTSTLGPFLKAADATTGFYIAPDLIFISIKTLTLQQQEDAVVTAVTQYASLAKNYRSAAVNNGRLVVFSYKNKDLAPSSWTKIRARLEDSNTLIYWVGDVDPLENGNPSMDTILTAVEQDIPSLDAGYSFRPLHTATGNDTWDALIDLFANEKKPWIGGLMPGYYRGQGIPDPTGYGPFGIDALGTYFYRLWWAKHNSAQMPWIQITTWNDYLEHTNITPDSDNGYARADITTWASANYKRLPNPITTTKIYLTSPQSLYLGQSGPVEALVLNPTSETLTVSVTLQGQTLSATVAPRSMAASTIHFTPQIPLPAGSVLRGVGQVSNASGVIANVIGAPILVYDTTTPSDNHAPPNYYSVGSDRSLPSDSIHLSLSQSYASITLAKGVTPRFVDLLHDNNLVKTFDGLQNIYSTAVPGPINPSSMTDDNFYEYYRLANPSLFPNYVDPGYYVVRVIDTDNKVGYSDPIRLQQSVGHATVK